MILLHHCSHLFNTGDSHFMNVHTMKIHLLKIKYHYSSLTLQHTIFFFFLHEQFKPLITLLLPNTYPPPFPTTLILPSSNTEIHQRKCATPSCPNIQKALYLTDTNEMFILLCNPKACNAANNCLSFLTWPQQFCLGLPLSSTTELQTV